MLSQLAGWMLFIAIVHFVGAGLLIIGGCCFVSMGSTIVGALANGGAAEMGGLGAGLGAMMIVGAILIALFGAVLIYQGVLLVQARGDFNQVVHSDTADQAHLTSAFRRLKIFFAIEVVLGALGLLSNAGQIVVDVTRLL